MLNLIKEKIKNYFKGFPWGGPEYQAYMDLTEPKFYTWNEAKKCQSDKK